MTEGNCRLALQRSRGVHLCIDGVGAKWGGTAAILQATIAAALRSDDVRKVTVFCSPAKVRRFELPADCRLSAVERVREDESALHRLHWLTRGLAEAGRAAGGDGVVALANSGCAAPDMGLVVMIQQALPFCKEALRSEGPRLRARMAIVKRVMKRSVERADVVVVQTRVMAKWVADAFPGMRARLEVLPRTSPALPEESGASRALDVMRAWPSGGRVLYVGDDWRYKNVRRVSRAVQELRKEGMPVALFSTTGSVAERAASECLVGLGFLKREEVAEAMKLADLLVMPSLVETVGLTMLEAMAAGTPVAVADRPYAREVCGEAAVYFDPLDDGEIAAVIGRALKDKGLRMRLICAGRQRVAACPTEDPYDAIVRFGLWAARSKSESGTVDD